MVFNDDFNAVLREIKESGSGRTEFRARRSAPRSTSAKFNAQNFASDEA